MPPRSLTSWRSPRALAIADPPFGPFPYDRAHEVLQRLLLRFFVAGPRGPGRRASPVSDSETTRGFRRRVAVRGGELGEQVVGVTPESGSGSGVAVFGGIEGRRGLTWRERSELAVMQ